MPLSRKKYAKLVLSERRKEINKRSLNGLGYFMDGAVEMYVQQYLETGDPALLERIPDYRLYRKA